MEEPQKGKKEKIRIITVILTIAISSLTAHFVPAYIKKYRLNKEIENYNKTLPQQLDEFSRMDSVKLTSMKSINYFLTVDILKEEANDSSIAANIHPNILHTIKTEPSLEDFRKNNFTWKYTYMDKKGVLFHEYEVTPEMYKESKP